VAGMIMSLFMSHRRVWVRISPEKDGARILLAGRSSRNPLSFQKEFEGLAEAFSFLTSGADSIGDAVLKGKKRGN